MAVSINGTSGLTFNDGTSVGTASSLGMRNRIINGAMTIDQRNAGSSITPTNGQYSVDRWVCALSQAGKYTVQQNAGGVPGPGGFKNYLGATSTSAYSVLASDYFGIRQVIEGVNVADLGWGAAGASSIVLSFYVYSSLTGTFGGTINNGAFTRSYPFSYSIPSANAWTKVSITVLGDTAGTWATDNSAGIAVNFSLGTGSTYSASAGSWAAGTYLSATGATSVVGTNGATFYITGVQFEVGSIATPFERRLYPQELAMCQRYYQKASGNQYSSYGATYNYVQWHFKVSMRTSPTLTGTSGSSGSLTSEFASLWTAGSAYASFADATASAEL
jgi:hypothetical protein